MDKEKLDHLKELAEKATQEPWDSLMCFGDEFENYIGPDSWVDDGKWIAAFRYAQDAKYIAAAQPATILALIAEIERLEEEADWLAATLARWDERFHLTGKPPKDAAYWRESYRTPVRGNND